MSWAQNGSAIKSQQRLKSKGKRVGRRAQPSPLALLQLPGKGWEQQPEKGRKNICQGWAHQSGGKGDLGVAHSFLGPWSAGGWPSSATPAQTTAGVSRKRAKIDTGAE